MSSAQGIVSGNIRAEMARRGLSQADLGAALNLTQSSIGKRLRNITPWSLPELETTARLLGVSMERLLNDPTEQPAVMGA